MSDIDDINNIKTEYFSIQPIAGESFGVRGFCFFVRTPDFSILLDPGCALGPHKRYKIPHPREFNQLYNLTDRIREISKQTHYIHISHYHHDHFKPKLKDNYYIYSNKMIFDEIFHNKMIFAKNIHENINLNQKKRGQKLFEDINHVQSQVHFISSSEIPLANLNRFATHIVRNIFDSESHIKTIQELYSYGNTTLLFPVAFHHGEYKNKQIYIQPLVINYKNETFYFFPDVQGIPMREDLLVLENLIDIVHRGVVNSEVDDSIRENPIKRANFLDIIALGGPMTYLRNDPIDIPNTTIQNAMKNCYDIIKKYDITIMDHHILRDIEFDHYWGHLQQIANAYDHQLRLMNMEMTNSIKEGHSIKETNYILESKRQELFRIYPPNSDFYSWAKKAQKNESTDKAPNIQ